MQLWTCQFRSRGVVMEILFLHGWHSTPGGRKPEFLRESGHTVFNPALCPDDFDLALKVAQESLVRNRPDIIVGSSRGGALAMNLDSGQLPLVLMCPAWKHWGSVGKVSKNTMIVHSRNDEVVPFQESLQLASVSALPKSHLIEVGTEHRLSSPEALEAMLKACQDLLSL